MILKERNACPICRSTQLVFFKKGTFDPNTIKTHNFKITDSEYGSLWTFSSCKSCGFVLSNPYVPEENIVEFYSMLKDQEYSMEAEGRAKNFNTILKRLNRVRKTNGKTNSKLIGKLNKNPDEPTEKPSLLDIGAASGIFLDLARQQNYDIQGVEPSSFLVREAKKRYDINLFEGTVQNFKPGKRFDVVTLLDILEHLVEPDAFMATVDTLIAKNGVLVVVTPDIGSLAAKITGKRWWHYRIAHINFFNLKAIRHLLEKHHYQIVLKKKYVWNFSVYYLVTRIFPFLKNKRTLQKILKRLHLKLPLFDSWEIYARKKNNITNNTEAEN